MIGTLTSLLDAIIEEARRGERTVALQREGDLSARADALETALADADDELHVATAAAADAAADAAAERCARTDIEMGGHVALDAISADGDALGTLLDSLTQVHASHVTARAALAASLADSAAGTPGSRRTPGSRASWSRAARLSDTCHNTLLSPPRTPPPTLPARAVAHTRRSMGDGARARARILPGRDGGARVVLLSSP